jgi:AcrR family transcriptional regulator
MTERTMPDKETRKKQAAARRRAQILKAAMDIFARKGFTAATMPEIAAKAGVAAGTIYLYFPNKRELFIVVIKNLIITTPLLNLVDRIPGENITVIFRQIMQERFDLIQSEEISRMPSFVGEVLRDPELKALWVERFFKPLFTQFESIFRATQAPGEENRIDPAVAVRAVAGLILGFILIKLLEGKNSPLNEKTREKVASDMVEFVLHGLLGTGEKKEIEK